MLAIAESGSTKCVWVILDKNYKEVHRVRTMGFNPDFHSSEDVYKELMSKKDEFTDFNEITQLYFYGAGCSSDRLKEQIRVGLSNVFTNANVVVDHDLTAAAFSLYEGNPIVACILGTGSNSCFFDGQKVSDKVPALGFLLGDEGGGGYFGKQLFRSYFYNLLTEEVAQDFWDSYHLKWEDVRKRLYQSDDANVYAASFMPFLAKHRNDPFIRNILVEGFQQFIDVHVKCFDLKENVSVNFVGSVAHYFKDIVEEVLTKDGIKMGRVIQSPIDHLVQYHQIVMFDHNSGSKQYQ